ncbi:hypothetical protein GGS20DRAFT_528858 [Poronia punctata]|nr:hypothetical protein GGS20DRAFT_528858 [Poronia punctata]
MADADLQKPGSAKRSLPFKRTAKPAQCSNTPKPDDDGLSLFSQSKTYFDKVVEEQRRIAREEAAKAEEERKAKLARQQEEEREAREAQLRREQKRKEAEAEREAAKKRRRPSIPSDDGNLDGSENEDDYPSDPPRKSRKASTPLFSPESTLRSSTRRSSRLSGSTFSKLSPQKSITPAIILDSSEDEDNPKTKRKLDYDLPRTESSAIVKPEDTDSDLEILDEQTEENEGEKDTGQEEKEEDPSEFYIRQAMERMRKAKEREASIAADGKDKIMSVTPGGEEEPNPPVSVMIVAPGLSGSKPLCCTVRTTQALRIAFETFKEHQKRQTKYPHQVISGLYFTWRGDRVYDTTSLQTLGIRPLGRDGRLHDGASGGRGAPEGYAGRDKVYLEAWTPEDYEANQLKRERARQRREKGEWWDEDEDEKKDQDGNLTTTTAGADIEAPPSQADERVKVIFKSRDLPPRNVTLRKFSTVAHMIKAFRKLTGVAEDKHIEIKWDGETLDLETTVEEADIGDMDIVEVHIR